MASFLNRVKNSLGLNRKSIEIEEFTEADKVFKEEKEEQLKSIDNKSSKYREKVERAIEGLKRDFKELEEFEDEKERSIIEDNIGNFVDERLRILENFSAGNEVRELDSKLDSFMEEFNSMSNKKKQVLEEANINDEFSESLETLTQTHEEIKEFIETQHTTKKRAENIETAVNRIQELENEIEEIKESKESLEASKMENQVNEKKEDLEKLEESEISRDYNQKKKKLERLKNERDSTLNDIGKALGRMERGLKKMLHEEKIGKISKKSSEILRSIRDGEKEEVLQYRPENVEKAVESLEKSIEGDFLGSSTRQSLIQGINFFRSFKEEKKELNKTQEEIQHLKEKIEEHDYRERKKKLEKEKEEAERQLEEAEKELQKLEDREEEVKSEIEESKSEIIHNLENEFDSEVSIKSD